MSCFRPLDGYRSREFGGKVQIAGPSNSAVRLGATREHGGNRYGALDRVELPCGKCEGCLSDRRRDWSIRCVHEAQLHEENWFVTLTYNEENLPAHGSLEYRDVQLLFKKLRKIHQFRYFAAGEYGSEGSRPHYHVLLFGWPLTDGRPFVNGTFRSEIITRAWDLGDQETEGPVIDVVNPATAAYVAGYCNKKVFGGAAREYYGKRVPEFVHMSNRPGLGSDWYAVYSRDLFPSDRVVFGGREVRVPRFYREKFRDGAPPGLVEEIEERAYQRARERVEDDTADRRAVREACAIARRELFQQRSL